MKSSAFLLLVGLVITGCATSDHLANRTDPANALPSWSPSPRLKEGIDALLTDSLFPPACVGIKVLSLVSGETLYALHPDFLFLPASNQKLLTSSAALRTLGEGYTFATRICMDTSVSPRIYVKGSGDPLLCTADIDSIVRRIAPLLPPGKRWTVCADLSLFDDLEWGKGWMWDDEPSTDAMFISPLSVNGNGIRVTVRPADTPGAAPTVSLEPPTTYVTIENTAVTVADSARTPLDISRDWRERTNRITVKGEIARAAPDAKAGISVRGPEWYALTLFREALAAHGVECEGLLSDTIPPRSSELFRFERRADSVIAYMNAVSDNLSAENFLKAIGAARYGPPGTSAAGLEVVTQMLQADGIDTARIVIADGSGVSRYNLESPSVIVRLLESMYRETIHFPALLRSLPVAGQTGTLAGRMRGTRAENNLRAKTGTLDGASTLSGYVITVDGELLVFSIMMQGFPGNSRDYRRVQDRIGAFLAELKRPR